MKALYLNAFCLFLIVCSTHAAQPTAALNDLESAWKFDLHGFSVNPERWDDALRLRMYQVGTAAAYAATLPCSLPHTVMFAIVMFGMVRLSWLLVAASCLALHGYKRKNRVFLGIGMVMVYALAFGTKLV